MLAVDQVLTAPTVITDIRTYIRTDKIMLHRTLRNVFVVAPRGVEHSKLDYFFRRLHDSARNIRISDKFENFIVFTLS